MSVSIKKNETRLTVVSPYNPSFVRWAKTRKGQFDRAQNAWVFDVRDEEDVRKRCIDIYGTDGDAPVDMVDVRIRLITEESKKARCEAIYVAGRQVARAWGKSTGAKLGDGCILVSGRIDSGGSVSNWETIISKGTVLELRDLPASKVESIDTSEWEVTIVRGAQPLEYIKAELPLTPEPAPSEVPLTIPEGKLTMLSDAIDVSKLSADDIVKMGFQAGKGLVPGWAEESPAVLDLSSVSTEDLLAELKRRGAL